MCTRLRLRMATGRRYRVPMPPTGSVEVWVAGLAGVPERLLGLLSADERERAARLLHERNRQRWRASRAVLRDLLGRLTGVEPAALEFEHGAHGKPRLRCFQDAPNFNVSHSGPLALCAVSWDHEIGVDLEVPDRGRSHERDEVAIARRFLGVALAERLQALEAHERTHEFLRAWVANEALLKCSGRGLGGQAPSAEREPAGQRSPWVTPVEVGEGVFAALAVGGGEAAVQVRRWSAHSETAAPRRSR